MTETRAALLGAGDASATAAWRAPGAFSMATRLGESSLRTQEELLGPLESRGGANSARLRVESSSRLRNKPEFRVLAQAARCQLFPSKMLPYDRENMPSTSGVATGASGATQPSVGSLFQRGRPPGLACCV